MDRGFCYRASVRAYGKFAIVREVVVKVSTTARRPTPFYSTRDTVGVGGGSRKGFDGLARYVSFLSFALLFINIYNYNII